LGGAAFVFGAAAFCVADAWFCIAPGQGAGRSFVMLKGIHLQPL
jgi:hypothetical protein